MTSAANGSASIYYEYDTLTGNLIGTSTGKGTASDAPPVPASEVSYAHDDANNRTEMTVGLSGIDGTVSYIYDASNRLIDIKEGGISRLTEIPPYIKTYFG